MKLRGAVAGALGCVAACGGPSFVYDQAPVPLAQSPAGALVAAVSVGDGRTAPRTTEWAIVDTGTPITLWNQPDGSPQVDTRTLTWLDAAAAAEPRPTRFVMADVETLGAPLVEVPLVPGLTAAPRAVIGADVLSRFSVAFTWKPPSVTFWARQPTDSGFFSAWGYAVLRLERYGGGQLDARGTPDFLGLRGPYDFPATRLVMRACAAPKPFAAQPLPERCCGVDDAFALSSGTDLALLVATGFGPVVLSQSAWNRVVMRMSSNGIAAPASLGDAPLVHPAWRRAFPAQRFALPRLALIDREAAEVDDPGPCSELARARRIELVARAQVAGQNVCVLPCDQDRRSRPLASNSAGYVELGADIEVAVVADESALLQALRAEIRPEGPEIDGILGSSAWSTVGARLELDYRSSTVRAIVACEPNANGVADPHDRPCVAVGQCPRLTSRSQRHACFELPPHGLPGMCDNLTTLRCE